MSQKEAWERRLGRTIRRYRMKKGMTLQKAADAYGRSLRHWQFLEHGMAINVKTLRRIAVVLGVKPSKLLD